jgi:hypothetical protein
MDILNQGQNTADPVEVRKEGHAPPSPPPSPIDSAPRDLSSEDKKTPRWKFKIPLSVRDKRSPDRDPKMVVLRELTPGQMETASRLGKGSGRKSTEESIKLSLWEVDGRRVNHGDAEADFYFSKWSPKIRVLLYQAWERIHLTSDDEDDAFLSSMEPAE